MTTTPSSSAAANVSGEALASVFRQWLGGYPNPEDPQPPGPWDPIIRGALMRAVRFGAVAGPHPDPWSIAQIAARRHPELWDLLGGPLSRVALNPQPLPPRFAFAAALADELIERAAFAQEIAAWLPQPGEQRGIIVVGGRLSQYVDELCGNGFKIKFPKPVPPPWWQEALHGADLVAMGVRFEGAAEAVNGDLGQMLSQAGAKLIEAGLSRLR
jgi:hypothetical protein